MQEKNTNAAGGKDCCAELRADDGRISADDPKNHKGDWGKHVNDKEQKDRKKKPETVK